MPFERWMSSFYAVVCEGGLCRGKAALRSPEQAGESCFEPCGEIAEYPVIFRLAPDLRGGCRSTAPARRSSGLCCGCGLFGRGGSRFLACHGFILLHVPARCRYRYCSGRNSHRQQQNECQRCNDLILKPSNGRRRHIINTNRHVIFE